MTAAISDAPKANIILTPFGITLNDLIYHYQDEDGNKFGFSKLEDEYPDKMNRMVFEVSPPEPNKHFIQYSITTACNDGRIESVSASSTNGEESAEILINLNEVYNNLASKLIEKYGDLGNIKSDEYVDEHLIRSLSIDYEKYNIFLSGSLDYDNKEDIQSIRISYRSKKYDNGCLVDETGL